MIPNTVRMLEHSLRVFKKELFLGEFNFRGDPYLSEPARAVWRPLCVERRLVRVIIE